MSLPKRMYSTRLFTTILIWHASLVYIGCLSDKTKSGEPPTTCSKAGDPCTFSPGKLGLCIEAVDHTLICQSQH